MTLPSYGQPIARIEEVPIGNLNIAGQALGDLIYFNGAAWTRLPVGAANQVLNVGAAGIPDWNPTLTGINLAGVTTFAGGPVRVLDDVLFTLGTLNDSVLVHNLAGLGADTALAGVLIGVPVTPAISANTIIISQVTDGGDVLMATRRGANSEAFFHMDASAGVLYLTPVQGGLTIGLATDAPAPAQGGVHIWAGDSSALTPIAGTLLTLENVDGTPVYISFSHLQPSGLLFGDAADADSGRFLYNQGINVFDMAINGTLRYRFAFGNLSFQGSAGTISTTVGALTLDPTTFVIISAARLLEAQGADVASANDMTLGGDGNVFEITGAVQINRILNTGWQNGSTIILMFTSTPTVKDSQASGGVNITILLDGSADFVASAGDTLQLTLGEIGGVQAWRQTGGQAVL